MPQVETSPPLLLKGKRCMSFSSWFDMRRSLKMVTAQVLSYATSRDISTFTTKGKEVSVSSWFDMRRSLNLVTAQELSYATSRDISTFTAKGEEVSVRSGLDTRRSLNMVTAQELNYATSRDISTFNYFKWKRCMSFSSWFYMRRSLNMDTAQELSYATSRDISTFTTKGEEVSVSSLIVTRLKKSDSGSANKYYIFLNINVEKILNFFEQKTHKNFDIFVSRFKARAFACKRSHFHRPGNSNVLFSFLLTKFISSFFLGRYHCEPGSIKPASVTVHVIEGEDDFV
jgi:hypothetical protein